MFTVRGKSGKVVGQYTTKAEAERRIAQLKAGAARLRPFRFVGRSSRSPHGWVEEIQAMLDKAGYAGDLKKHAERLVREGYGPEEIAYRIRTGQIERGLGIQMVKKGTFRMSPHERQEYTVFKRSKTNPRAVKVVQHDLTISEARAMCARINADPRSRVYGEFTTNENFRASFPNARRLSRSQSPSTGTKQKIYRGFLIKISHGGTWCEGNIYKKDGSLAEHIGSGSCGPGASLKAATIGKMIERGERIIDAMHGD